MWLAVLARSGVLARWSLVIGVAGAVRSRARRHGKCSETFSHERRALPPVASAKTRKVGDSARRMHDFMKAKTLESAVSAKAPRKLWKPGPAGL